MISIPARIVAYIIGAVVLETVNHIRASKKENITIVSKPDSNISDGSKEFVEKVMGVKIDDESFIPATEDTLEDTSTVESDKVSEEESKEGN